MKWKQRKAIKKEILEAPKQIDHWYRELEKMNPLSLQSDKINIEINRLRSIKNDRQMLLLLDKINFLSIGFGILLVGLIVSFFVKPQIQFNFTVSIAVGLIVTFSGATILTIIVKHHLTKEDREAKRQRDMAEASYLELQVNLKKKDV